MAKTIKIPLDTPIVWHKETYSEVILREPSFNDIMELGNLSTLAVTEDGTRIVVENVGTYREYLDRCLVEPKNAAALEQASGRVAVEVRRAIDGFFRDGDPAPDSTETSPTSLSSAPVS